jgi:hypothetical protein
MTRRIPSTLLILAFLGLVAGGCQSTGVGDPCIPEDEYQQNFPGYAVDEVNVESRSFQCETRVCLVNHFQGRVSCPYGQTAKDALGPDETLGTADDNQALPGNSDTRCRIPGTSGDADTDQIKTAVDPQLVSRQTDKAVYCSCRCKNAQGGTDDGARYCECPSGFSCEKLLDDLGLGSSQLAGYYCIREGTKYDPTTKGGQTCVPGLGEGEPGYCGNNGKNPPNK